MRINRPAKPGDELDVCAGFIDVPKGIYKLNETDFFHTASLPSSEADEPLSGEEAHESDNEDEDASDAGQVAEGPAH